MSRCLAPLAAALCALSGLSCADGLVNAGESTSEAVDAPLLGQAAKTDGADHGCRIVLRTVGRVSNNTGGYVTNCVDGQCFYVWQGTLDLSADAVAAGAPAVLFQSGSDPTWYRAAAQAIPASDGGHLYSFKIDNHTVTEGMSTTSLMRTRIQVAPVLEMTDGSRLFDHNRIPGDFDNYVLDSSNYWSVSDDASCPRVAPRATVRFLSDWTTLQSGAIVAGGKLTVDYDLSRLPQCVNSTYQGSAAWGTSGFARFSPSGQVVTGPVSQYLYRAGSGYSVGKALWDVDVPAGTTKVELWFSTSGETCATYWDSAYGHNYAFAVTATPTKYKVGWAGDWGSMVSRGCMASDRQASVPEPLTLDSWALTRATCLYVEVDVWVPGVTDAATAHPELLQAQVLYRRDGGDQQVGWLEYQGRVGNNYRYRFDLWRSGVDFLYTPWDKLTWALRFSTDGNAWFQVAQGAGPDGGALRSIARGADWCPASWGAERCPQ